MTRPLDPPGVPGPPGVSDSECHPRSGCITCSDEGIPMRLSAAPRDGLAVCIDEQGNESEVMTALVEPIGPDDWVLVHAGTALIQLDDPSSVSPGGRS